MKKKQTGVILMLAALSLMSIQPVEACTRAVYLGPEQLVITGRTMERRHYVEYLCFPAWHSACWA